MSREALGEIASLVHQYTFRRFGLPTASLTFNLPNGDRVTMQLPQPEIDDEPARPRAALAGWASGPEPKHLSDFQKVYWPGLGEFRLTAKQAASARLLWDAMEEGTHEVGQAELLRAADSDCTRLRDLFSRSPAWGTLIVQGATPGSYRLPPSDETS
jgi:hypothetical protein